MSGNLNAVLNRARRSVFYKKHLAGKIQFDEAPLTTKSDLREQYPFGLLATDKSRVLSYHESSGTAGAPVSSYFSKSDWEDIAERFNRSGINLNPKDTFFIKTPYSMVTTAHQAQRAAELVGALIVPGDNRSANMPLSRVVQLLKDLEVSVTWSLPTEVIFWALAAKEQGLNPKTDFPFLRAFWVAGEPLSAAKKRLIEKLWGGKRIYEDYGSTETGSLAGECSYGTLHAWSDRIHFELLDTKTGSLSESGEGQLIVTPLFREAMPLVRYNTEDQVVIAKVECPCGSKLPKIQVKGRAGSSLCVDGVSVNSSQIEELIYEVGLSYELSLFRAFYGNNRLEIDFFIPKVELGSECSGAIAQALKTKFSIAAKINAVNLDSLVPLEMFRSKLSFNKPQYFIKKDGLRDEVLKKNLIYY